MKKEFSGGGGEGKGESLNSFYVAASRVPSREDVIQRYYDYSASLLAKSRNTIFRLAISGHLPFECYVR